MKEQLYISQELSGPSISEFTLYDWSPDITLCYIENGTRCMSLETLVSVANALGVTADALLCDSLDNQLNACVAELEYILKDCTNYERRLLLDAVRGLKQSLKDNYYLKK